jgi:hypothetical protein
MNRNIHSGREVSHEDIELLPLILDEVNERQPRRRGKQGYMDWHTYLREVFGSAREHRCVDCKRSAHHWSLSTMANAVLDVRIGHWWSPELNDYLPRCSSCHQRHDVEMRKTAIKGA